MGYAEIKATAKAAGVNIPSLLPLSCNNDPFFCGSPQNKIDAQWFAEIWKSYGSTGHIRRIHYKILNIVKKPDGELYRNTKADYTTLNRGSRAARYLGLIAPEEFTDMRNAEAAILGAWDNDGKTPDATFDQTTWDIPQLSPGDIYEPYVDINGYDYNTADQPYVVEVWIEKSTMQKELLPICQEYQANYVSGTGYTSVTRIVELLRRSEETGKPVRIFYLSDFDPAGKNMPVHASRHLQFWKDKYAPGADVQLTSLALTKEQQELYHFTTDEAGTKVELDAIEAERPGLFAEIVGEALSLYHDAEIKSSLRKANKQAYRQGYRELGIALEPCQDWKDDIQNRIDAMIAKYPGIEEEFSILADEMRHLESEYEGRGQEVEDNFIPPDRPETTYVADDSREWLYDSSRDYDEQTQVLIDHKNETPDDDSADDDSDGVDE
jgi:hypothetical protein